MSYNRFADRDKLRLVGSTDSLTAGDPGKLRVTFHHKEFINIGQRAPRLRWRHADIHNNHFIRNAVTPSALAMTRTSGRKPTPSPLAPRWNSTRIIKHWKGQAITTIGNVINRRKVDLLAAYSANAAAELQLVSDTSWQPTLRTRVHPAQAVPGLLKRKVGPVLTLDRGRKRHH